MKKIKKLELTCGACPSQWEGEFEDGTPLYIRYRWGYLAVSEGVTGKTTFGRQVGGGLDGTMNLEEMLAITGLELA